MHPALQGLITIILGVGGCLAYFYLANQLLDKVIFPPRPDDAGRNINRANIVRPWLFLFPALFALGLYLAYPVFETLRLSLTDRSLDGAFVGLANYQKMFGEEKFWEALRNNMLWLIVVPAVSTAFGLLVAQLTDRIAWGNIAKSLIFMPMAISFVGASVIFKPIYDARPVSQEQIGVMNAVWLQFDGGFGSFLFLRLLPAVMLLGFAIAVGNTVWVVMRPILIGQRRAGWLLSALQTALSAFGLYLVILAVINIFQVFRFEYAYGQPQTWLTLPFWNNFSVIIC